MKYTFKDRSLRQPDTGIVATLGKPDLENFLTIRVDSREQLPIDFNSDYVKAGRGCVPCFDYALEGDEENFALERKSLPDFIQSVCIQKNWIRELHKIAKAKEWELPIFYILEFSWDDIETYDYSIFTSGAITSQFVYRRVSEMEFNFGVHMAFRNSRQGAAYGICLLLKRRKESLRVKTKKVKPNENM